LCGRAGSGSNASYRARSNHNNVHIKIIDIQHDITQ